MNTIVRGDDERSMISGRHSHCGQSTISRSRLKQPTLLTKSPALNATLEKIEKEELEARLFRTMTPGDE